MLLLKQYHLSVLFFLESHRDLSWGSYYFWLTFCVGNQDISYGSRLTIYVCIWMFYKWIRFLQKWSLIGYLELYPSACMDHWKWKDWKGGNHCQVTYHSCICCWNMEGQPLTSQTIYQGRHRRCLPTFKFLISVKVKSPWNWKWKLRIWR